jgi:hypothetical protein
LRKVYSENPQNPGFGAASRSYRIENQSVFNGIARRTGFTTGTVQMSNYYFMLRFENLSVGSSDLEDFATEICDWIEQKLPTRI